MRVKYSWALVLLLSGCQLTQPDNQDQASEQTNTSPAKEISQSEVSVSKAEKEQPKVEAPVATPQTQQDVWKRIAMQLEMDVPNHKKVDYYRTWYLKHPNHLKTVSKRAEPFLYLITEKIEEKGLPLELALLPVVESSFDAFATLMVVLPVCGNSSQVPVNTMALSRTSGTTAAEMLQRQLMQLLST